MTRTFLARLAALLTVAAIVLAACGPTTPIASPQASGTPSTAPSTVAPASAAPASDVPSASPDDASAVFDAIEAQVLEIRGLAAVQVERATIDEDELVSLTTADFDKDYPESYVLANERLYKALGLMDEGDSLRDLYLELIGSQVAGFYRPDTKKLYVVSRSGTIGAGDKVTFAHEYGHALQDASFPIFADQDALKDQTDEALGRAGLYEGDATTLMIQWAQGGHLTPAEIGDYVKSANDPEAAAILARMPAILIESLLFPYTKGLEWVLPIQAADGWAAVDALYESPPLSTEQVLHPDKYAARETPIKVEIASGAAGRMGDGWSVALEDSWGEFQTGIWLRESGVPVAEATAAAAGWGGDRLAVLNGPEGAWAVVIDTRWDDPAEGEEFLAAAEAAIAGLDDPASVSSGGDGDVTVMIASDDAALLSLDRIFGDTGA